MQQYANVCIDVWGDWAMFTRPDSHVERATYPIPTPAACRGVLSAIYNKPVEFYYEITQIDVMKPIRLMTLKRNEVKTKANVSDARNKLDYFINTTEQRTQRMCTYIRDVYYRIHARIVVKENVKSHVNLTSLVDQFQRRVKSGKCFYQPVLGTRECMCYFSLPDDTMKPIDKSDVFGVVLYDVFDIRDSEPFVTGSKPSGKTVPSFFNAVMEHGSIRVPLYESNEILIRRDSNV